MKEALMYQKRSDGSVCCTLCRHRCVIPAGRRGRCHVRENCGGTLYSLVYGHVVAEHIDPVEKKPLFHFLPGSRSYSIATVGCNFSCLHCQNHSIAQYSPREDGMIPGEMTAPETIIERALQTGCRSISYTYTEPTIFFEYALDVARLAHQAGLKNIFVTNGYMTPEALDLIAPYLDAANIDLKGFSETFYRRVTGAGLADVLDCIVDYHRRGIWLEITTLVIPGENDDEVQLHGIAEFIAERLGSDVPWHISRYFPQYRMMDHPVTPAARLSLAASIASGAGLCHVYEGNLPGGREDTLCPACGVVVVKRQAHAVRVPDNMTGGCPVCHARVAGVWS